MSSDDEQMDLRGDALLAVSEGDYWFQFEHPDPGTVAKAQAAYTKALALATLAFSPPTGVSDGVALDVDRLARALGSTGNCGHSSCPRDTSRHDDEARELAAEYQRLAREQADSGDKPR